MPRMGREQARKQIRSVTEHSKHVRTESVVTSEKQHHRSHLKRPPQKSTVELSVGVKIPSRQGFRQRVRLAKRQAQSLAGNGVHTARSVAYQSNIPAPHAAKLVHRGYGSTFAAGPSTTHEA